MLACGHDPSSVSQCRPERDGRRTRTFGFGGVWPRRARASDVTGRLGGRSIRQRRNHFDSIRKRAGS
ncbi:hypothetical protein [Lysobacter gummosus]|uniref:hypothetical protein n=1 Tax=Lysobacter gummosus TaxID=262324 RepID=UPI00362C62BB